MVETPAHTTHTWRFGMFQVDAREGKLLRAGISLRIREQSFRVLVLLLEHAGELVTRDQLRAALWPSDTFVDFEHGLNTAVMKLREALDDSAETPLYIETVPKRGYRFIAPLAAQSETQEKPANPNPGFVAPVFNGPSEPEHPAVGASPSPRISRSYARIAAAIGLVLILAATLIALYVRGWRDRFSARPPQVQALAVLPFTNLSRDPGQEYFSDGMTDALITELGTIRGPRVISRQSIMKFKGSQKSMEEIAHELKVDAIVEGAVEQSGDRVWITVHLAQGNPERQIWAEQYDRDIRDVLAVQADIAHSVANAIRTALSRQVQIPATRRVNPEAYQADLQGRYHYEKLTFDGLSKAEASLRRSVDVDPTFAPAYSAMASLYSMMAIIGLRPPAEVQPLAKAAALEALRLDDRLAEAHTALGVVKQGYDWDWPGAEQEPSAPSCSIRAAPRHINGTRHFSPPWAVLTKRFEKAGKLYASIRFPSFPI